MVQIGDYLKMDFEAIWNEAREAFSMLSIDHGPVHWETVERNVNSLADADERIDRTVARLFAILHDCKRQNESFDPDHGRRAGVFARKLFAEGKLPITGSQLATLVYALDLHNDGITHEDPTIGACWDADRLDLPRVGIKTEEEFLSTEAAKQKIRGLRNEDICF